MKIKRIYCLILGILFSQSVCFSFGLLGDKPIPAFPGAEGFGCETPGGRGGKVLIVDNLQDYDPSWQEAIPGSLRWAVSEKYPRIIVFNVSGNIDLQAPLIISEPFITLAGQSAPGDGICLRNNSLIIAGNPGNPVHDVVVRYLRIRPGDKRKTPVSKAPVITDDSSSGNDGIDISLANNIIIDHCSISWAVDENMGITAAENITVQNCIISEGLHNSVHYKGPHSKGVIIGYGADKISFHHNLIMHCADRNPYFPAEGENEFIIDFRNNLVYNWWINAGVSYPKTNHMGKINFIGNHFIRGFDSWERSPLTLGVNTRVYAQDNIWSGGSDPGQDEYDAISWTRPDASQSLRSPQPFHTPSVNTHAAKEVIEHILQNSGATLPIRDQVDLRLIEELKLHKGRIIDHPLQVGGWPELSQINPLLDQDRDGIPDEWERKHGLDPQNPLDAGDIEDNREGYPWVEKWLNALGSPNWPEWTDIECTGSGSPDDPVRIPWSGRRIIVDAKADEWMDIPSIPLLNKPKNGCRVKMAWREDGLYGFVYAEDSLLHIYEPEPYRGDCFELLIDRLNSKKTTRDESKHSCQIIFSPTENLIPGEAAINIPRDWPRQGTEYIFSQWKKTNNGYIIEFVLPDVAMKPALLQAGQKIGLDFSLNDEGKETLQFYPEEGSNNTFFPEKWGTILLDR